MRIESDYECRNAERPNTARLCVFLLARNEADISLADGRSTNLLNPSNISSDVFHCNRVFNCQTVALALYSCLVDEHSSIGGESYELAINMCTVENGPRVFRTCKCKTDVIVEHCNFSNGARILKLQN